MQRQRLVVWGVLFVLAVAALALLKTCAAGPYKNKTLLDLLILYRAELDAPGLTVDEAASHLKNADKALAFVRDDIVLTPYAGRRQYPDDVLRNRAANTVDKAALLGALLEKQGWTVRYLSHDWPGNEPYARKQKAALRPSPALKTIARRIGFDLAGLDAEWRALDKRLGQTRANIAASVNAANQVLIDKAGYNPEYSTTTGAPFLRHIVVEGTKKGRRKVFDPVYFKSPLPKSMDSYTLPWPTMPVMEVRLADGRGGEQTLLHQPALIAGRDVKLHFLPAVDTAKALAGPARPQAIALWRPVLSIDGKDYAGRPFSIDGDAPGLTAKPPLPDLQAFSLADPAQARAMQIARVEARDWPRVRLAVNVVADGAGSWVPAHFAITDNGKAVHPRLLNIRQVSKPVMILTDVSPSMKDIGAFEASKKAIIALARHLPPTAPAGLTSFAMDPLAEVSLSPLGDGTALTKAAEAMSTRSWTGIFRGLDYVAGLDGLDNGIVVLLSDGADNVGGDADAVIKALKKRHIRVFALALGADSDTQTMEWIAQETGGFYAKIRNAQELEPLYARLGSALTSYVMLEYDAPQDAGMPDVKNNDVAGPSTSNASQDTLEKPADGRRDGPSAMGASETPGAQDNGGRAVSVPAESAESEVLPEASAGVPHHVVVRLKGRGLEAAARYVAALVPPVTRPPRLLLHIEMPVGGQMQQIDRLLIDLGDPDAPWALTGDYTLMEDLGGFGPKRMTAAYVSQWIEALRQKTDPQKAEPDFTHPSFDLVETINSFRALSVVAGHEAGVPGSGPNLYLRRSTISPGNASPVRRRIFDVLFRARRGYLVEGDHYLPTPQARNIEIAGAVAEGLVIGGDNGIDALLAYQDSIETFNPGESRPDWLAPPLRDLHLYKPKPEDSGGPDKMLVSKNAPEWAWIANAGFENGFRAVYGHGSIFAKGASVEQIASEFDRIDKMYQIYNDTVGNMPGPYASTGVLLAALASMKRQENKLWCFSTVMMGYVANAIGDENALLNRDAKAAKAKAASLCKIEGSPDDGPSLVKNAVREAVRDGVTAWKDNLVHEGTGDAIANGRKAWAVGGALSNAAALYRSDAAVPVSPVTPGFHQAMARAISKESPTSQP